MPWLHPSRLGPRSKRWIPMQTRIPFPARRRLAPLLAPALLAAALGCSEDAESPTAPEAAGPALAAIAALSFRQMSAGGTRAPRSRLVRPGSLGRGGGTRRPRYSRAAGSQSEQKERAGASNGIRVCMGIHLLLRGPSRLGWSHGAAAHRRLREASRTCSAVKRISSGTLRRARIGGAHGSGTWHTDCNPATTALVA